MKTQMNFKKERVLVAGLLTTLALSQLAGCANKSDSAATVTTNVVMTGSSGATTVAQNVKSLWQKLFFPQAIANTPPSLVDASGATVVLNSAWVVIKEIEFKAEELSSAGEEVEVSLQGPYFVNLVDPAATVLGEATVPDMPLRRIKFQFHKTDTALPVTAPASLTGNSIVFEGTVGGASFTYLADDSTEVNVGGGHGVAPSAGANLLVAVKMADLFKKIDLSGIVGTTTISASNRVAGSNLCPLIDASANDLYTCFRKGIESESKMGRDDDGSGEIEDTEEEVDDIG